MYKYVKVKRVYMRCVKYLLLQLLIHKKKYVLRNVETWIVLNVLK